MWLRAANTRAVLGGGSDALHQMVLVFTNFMGTTAKRVKGWEGGLPSHNAEGAP